MIDAQSSATQDSASLTLQWALYLAQQRKWKVFPGRIKGKSKCSWKSANSAEGEGKGVNWGATRHLDEIRADFADPTRQIIGVPTGPENGFVVVEFDTPDGHGVDGETAFNALVAENGGLPDTLQAKSPTGSHHFFFKHPGFYVKTTVGTDTKGLAPGVDVKGDGGMVFAAPSIRPDGPYAWLTAPDFPIAEAPPWLLDWFRNEGGGKRPNTATGIARVAPAGLRPAPGTQAAKVLATACEKIAATECGRNTMLNEQAFIVGKHVGSGEIGRDVAEYDLLAACDECGLLAEDGQAQCLATIRSGMPAGMKDPARTSVEMFGNVTVAAQVGAMPMLGAQQVICDEGLQIVGAFNQAHPVALAADAPVPPLDMHAAPLRGPLTEAIGKMVTLADTPRATLKFDLIGDVLGVLAIAHAPTLAPVVARIRQSGTIVPDNRIKRAETAFEARVQRETRVGQGWRTNNKGEPDPDVSENVDVLLDRLGASLRFNLWKQRPEYRRGDETWRPLTDDTVKSIWMDARSENIRYKVSKPFLQDAFDAICHRTEVDPALDKINSIVWDGVARLDTWIHYTCGAPIDSYHRAVSRNVIGGIVKRLRHPGCKHDETLLLIGEQGTGKSSVAHILALHKDWHTDTLDVKLPVKELAPAMSAKLIVEFAEIDQYTRKDVARVKQFITTINDAGTMKFDKYASDHFRRCIFICTTNSDTPLKDATGNRRFLPVHVLREVDERWLRQNVEQIIAEAAHYESAGETFGIPREVWADADVRQEAVRDLTSEEEAVLSWFGATEDSRECRWMWASDLSDAFRHQRMNPKAKIGRTMKSMGYESDRRTVGSRRDRCWFRNWPKYSEFPPGARQWNADLKMGQPVAKWRLLAAAPPPPAQLTTAQARVMQMRTSRCLSEST